MSYHPRTSSTLGDVLTTVATGVSQVGGAVGAAASVMSDPYFPEVVCRVQQLDAINARKPKPNCTKTRSGIMGGVGLRRVMTPLRAFVYAEQNQWVYPVAILAVLGLPFMLGYSMKKGSP